MVTMFRFSGLRFALLALPLAAASSAANTDGPAAVGRVGAIRYFEPNAGQADARARFLLRTPRGTVFFTPSEIVLASPAADPLRIRFLGANPAPRIEAGAALPGTVNYLLGNDPKRWHTGLATHSGITYADLYPGVALAYAADGRPLKGTYTVAPRTDPGRIRWRYQGGQARLDAAGALHVGLPNGAVLTEDAPIGWQDVAGGRVPVRVDYAIAPDGSVGFAVGAYDRERPLTIDPVITYSTFLGGSIFDIAWGIAVHPGGSAYIAGYTASSDFPTLNPYQPSTAGQGDAFVARFNPDGTLAYATYLGGDYLDYATDIAVDSQGNAYVTGFTGSADFPTHMAVQPTYAGGWDAFVTKLNPAGSALVYSTYLGGSGQENRINAGVPGSIAVDAAGSAYVTGNTGSANFPTVLPFQPALRGSEDAFVTKFSADGSALVYSTYLGGERGDTGWGIAVDGGGSAVVTGETTSDAFPTANAFQPQCASGFAGCWDAFVTRFNPAGSALVFSTYIGGNDLEYVDRGFGVAIDAMGTAYVSGATGSPNFPMRNAYQPFYGGQIDAFVLRFDSGGTLLSSTFLGGNNSEIGNGIAVYAGPPVAVYVAGLTLSSNFPVVNPIQGTLGGFEDGFVARFTGPVDGLVFSTYLGGSNGREEYGFMGVGVDAAGSAYVAGGSEASDYPLVNPHQAAPQGSYDAVVTRIDPSAVAAFALSLDAAGNAVFEPNETAVMAPTWRNSGAAAMAVSGAVSSFAGPAGATYTIVDAAADYGTIAAGGTASCGADCYSLNVAASSRPAAHWDGTILETMTPTAATKNWTLHVGGSFTDVPASSGFYRFVETILHRNVTGGCTTTAYCPGASTTREQMAVFVLVAREAAGYMPPACGATPAFADVPATSPFCRWVEELARRGVVGGCGGGNYCPSSPATREQMAVFVLRTLDPALTPPACGTPVFSDVPASSAFCRWIEEMARRGVVTGCGGGNYCPTADVSREQMSVFLAATFGLTLYGL